MLLARVVGRATSTVKDPSMAGQKLLVVQPVLADGRTADGFPFLAVDAVGCGSGDTVMITSDGKGARDMLKAEKTPVRWMIIGIRD
jgi:ethanolamine utilization protein EutN